MCTTYCSTRRKHLVHIILVNRHTNHVMWKPKCKRYVVEFINAFRKKLSIIRFFIFCHYHFTFRPLIEPFFLYLPVFVISYTTWILFNCFLNIFHFYCSLCKDIVISNKYTKHFNGTKPYTLKYRPTGYGRCWQY